MPNKKRSARRTKRSFWYYTKSFLFILAMGFYYLFRFVVLFFHWIHAAGTYLVTKAKLEQKKYAVKKALYSPEVQKKIKTPPISIPFKVIEAVKGSLAKFIGRLETDSLIITICGKRGSGKSALGFRLLENIHSSSKRPCFVLGVRQEVLPSWIVSVRDLAEVKTGGVVVVDEGAVSFSSRQSMSKENKELSSLLALARHKDLTLILITQNTGMIDKNVLGLTDTLLIKEGSLLQTEMERNFMKKMYDRARAAFAKSGTHKGRVYVVDTEFEGMISAELPSFWTAQVSKSHSVDQTI